MRALHKFSIIFIITYLIRTSENVKHDLEFPEGLLIGAATSAYQVEGAWNIDGKQENIWDYYFHNHAELANQSNGDVATDMYHKYKEDVKLLKNFGFDSFRFSISWARILPTGYADYINREGVNYYHRLLDELEKQGIKPIVTIYHWDHPQILESIGGWLNEQMAFLYSDYARVIFQEFGHRVQIFATLNEPYIVCGIMYKSKVVIMSSEHASTNYSGWGEYTCIHNMLKAHALAYHIYNREFRHKQNGKIGLVTPCNYWYNEDDNDTLSAEIAFEFHCGCVLNPIFSEEGDYPKIMKERIAERSKLQGYNTSRLPTFSKEWIELIKGSSDFLGLNHYTSNKVKQLPYSQILEWPNDEGLEFSFDPEWLPSSADWLKVAPKGFGDLLRKLKSKYNNPHVYVLENGVADNSGIDDNLRIIYLYSYMKEMLIAIKRDDCNIQIYTVWSFLDSFEWELGYTIKFGIVHVDFNDKERRRTAKKSALWLKDTLKSRKLVSFT